MAINLQVDQDLNATAQPVKDSNGNTSPLAVSTDAVGIGTASPRKKLHVVGPAPADANEAQIEVAASNGHFMLLGRTDAYGFVQSHNREPLALNPLGNNVGIGTTSPAQLLHVKGSLPILVLQDSEGTGASQSGYVSLRDRDNSEKGWFGFGSERNTILGITNRYPDGILAFYTAEGERMRISEAGLEVQGDIQATGDVRLLDVGMQVPLGAREIAGARLAMSPYPRVAGLWYPAWRLPRWPGSPAAGGGRRH
jgi:hypothetical protein